MILFGVWAPDEATFWASWITVGICTAPRVFAPGYAGSIDISDQTSQGWVPMKDGQPVPGWHANVRVWGNLESMFRAGCPTVGTIWETTHAAQAFGLTDQPADPETGFPAGMRSSSGVVYADANQFHSPSNVWA